MKKVLKKIYDVLPKGIKKLYWQTRKKVGQILMFRIVFPLGYKHYIKGKKIKRKKAVFVEVRFDEITDSFRLVYDRMRRMVLMFMSSLLRILNRESGDILSGV